MRKYYHERIAEWIRFNILPTAASWAHLQAGTKANCHATRCQLHTHVGDLPAVLSYWRPDADELAALNAGGAVRLWVVGATMPPVMLDVEIA